MQEEIGKLHKLMDKKDKILTVRTAAGKQHVLLHGIHTHTPCTVTFTIQQYMHWCVDSCIGALFLSHVCTCFLMFVCCTDVDSGRPCLKCGDACSGYGQSHIL